MGIMTLLLSTDCAETCFVLTMEMAILAPEQMFNLMSLGLRWYFYASPHSNFQF